MKNIQAKAGNRFDFKSNNGPFADVYRRNYVSSFYLVID